MTKISEFSEFTDAGGGFVCVAIKVRANMLLTYCDSILSMAAQCCIQCTESTDIGEIGFALEVVRKLTPTDPVDINIIANSEKQSQ